MASLEFLPSVGWRALGRLGGGAGFEHRMFGPAFWACVSVFACGAGVAGSALGVVSDAVACGQGLSVFDPD